MIQAVVTRSPLRVLLSTLFRSQSTPKVQVLRNLTGGERAALLDLADRGNKLLSNFATATDKEFVEAAERSIVEPLRTIYRSTAGERRPLDERRLNNALIQLDSAIGSLADNLIDREDAEMTFEEGLLSLEAAAD